MKISLFCNAGMSTSLVASKLKKAYDDAGVNNTVSAHDFSSLSTESEGTDVIILGPQIAWAYDDVVNDYPTKKVILLTIQEFGSMNGETIKSRLDQEL
ncbi:PTS sugar transporter subunit IIB [Peribacillus muralis]|uniref:PTS sugar transporter subunit IIB n=1 Tax=Peribacillus muralis TaxID=264697 RepID=UPI00071117EC|nr:transcription antiterminator [Peribacillus muralis]